MGSVFRDALARLAGRAGDVETACPETGGAREIERFHGDPFCSECGREVETVGRRPRRRYEHPD